MSKTAKLPRAVIKINDGLELRALTLDDAEELFTLTTRNKDYLAEYLPWVDKVNQVADSKRFITGNLNKRLKGERYGFGVIVNGKLAGHISLMHVKDKQTPEIGYWITESAAGRGIMTRAAGALTDFGFRLGLEKILIKADAKNIASNRIAEKLGYRLKGAYPNKEGELRNHWIKQRNQGSRS